MPKRHTSIFTVLLVILALTVLVDGASAMGFRTSQESVTTAAAELMGNLVGRTSIILKNHDTANPVYCGDSGVTSATGLQVVAGAAVVLDNAKTGQSVASLPLYCRATGGTVTVSLFEVVDN